MGLACLYQEFFKSQDADARRRRGEIDVNAQDAEARQRRAQLLVQDEEARLRRNADINAVDFEKWHKRYPGFRLQQIAAEFTSWEQFKQFQCVFTLFFSLCSR